MQIDCPRAKSAMTPCIARDGNLALTDPPSTQCVGCGERPRPMLEDLSERFPPARQYLQGQSPDVTADRFAELVRAYVAAKPDPTEDQ